MLVCNTSMDYLQSSIFVCFQANDGNWPILKQSSAPVVKPPQISNTDWKESSMDTALKQGTISSQPLPTSVLGSTDKLVGFICDIFIDLLCWNYEPLAFIAELTSITHSISLLLFILKVIKKIIFFLFLPVLITLKCVGFFQLQYFVFLLVLLVSAFPSLLLLILSPLLHVFLIHIFVSLFPLYRLLLFQCTLFLKSLTKKVIKFILKWN